ncbi:ankyrin repeat domain-containing protein [Coraliomargarita sp. SDUM461003]|uniref:Ankyrin repeat domain-containing protein n=1 Tax=Thalassobacterium maritimum TaxID=3041265 RepID=A0ABU1AV82_9BACT|nr:ankyrin repeat domain-containing protein [Coraliomargarita sp. SDUM461003]MDQ8208060.1 ankyrin repeat domain-containing protein [Coraliomargarita sp. SDUM461003]
MENTVVLEDSHPIFEACEKGDAVCVRNYLEAGVPVTAKSRSHAHLITTAVKFGYVEIVKALIEFGVDLNEPVNTVGQRPIDFSISYSQKQIAEVLLDNGATPDTRLAGEMTPLMSALSGNELEIAQKLLDHGADPTLTSYSGESLYHWAASSGSSDALEFVKRLGLNINVPNRQGQTALLRSAQRGDVTVVKWLIENGADPTIADRSKRTPLYWAERNKREGVVDLLQAYNGQ